MDETKKSLVLGIGSQSSGTLLLYKILNECSDIAMHPLTELHYFDTLYNIRQKKILTQHAQRVYDYEHDKFQNEYNQTYFNLRHETLLKSSKKLATTEVKEFDYLELFDPMYSEEDVLGEITPEYMLLGDDEVEKMSAYVGRESKIILLVRDPVDRFLDSLRLLQPEMFTYNKREFEKKLLESMLDHSKWLDVQDSFNQYEKAYQRYRKNFDHVLMLPYEKFEKDPGQALKQLEEFLELPVDRTNAILTVKSFFKEQHKPVKITNSLNLILSERYKNTTDYLHGEFHDLYKSAVTLENTLLVEQKEKIMKQTTRLFTQIENIDWNSFFIANSDLKETLTEKNDDDSELKITEKILEDLVKGIRSFHMDYAPFSEKLYVEIYPDVQKLIKNDTVDIRFGFDHFCLSGYKEILAKTRIWPKKNDHQMKDEDALVLSMPWADRWMKEDDTFDDPFYVSTFLHHFDTEKYLKANPDVQKAVTSADLDGVKEHLLYHGILDITEGRRNPYPGVEMADAILVSVDFSYRIDEDSLLIMGWLHTNENERKIEKVYLSNGEHGYDLTENLSRFERPDLENMLGTASNNVGFCIFVEASIIDMESEYALLFVCNDGLTKCVPTTVEQFKNAKDASQKILSPLAVNTVLFENLDRTMGVALQKYMHKHPLVVTKESLEILNFGKIPEKPKVSIIVPLYGRIDFVEYQLSLFANDPFFAENVDLIYVLDDPSMKDALILLAQELHPLFEIPFRVVIYDENYGYAIANNIGASYAKADTLLLLNSDIMPLDKEWLPTLLETYDKLDNVGALGCKLLFEDGAIQHAGMAFEKSERFGMWLNEHPGKGLPDLRHKVDIEEVPAVTAACLMVDHLLYEKVGGLSENYLLGDFEDSDFCLKMIMEGKKNYYLPTVSLCHLERQSQNLFSDTSWKTKLTLFNGWQHTKKWNTMITKLMGDN